MSSTGNGRLLSDPVVTSITSLHGVALRSIGIVVSSSIVLSSTTVLCTRVLCFRESGGRIGSVGRCRGRSTAEVARAMRWTERIEDEDEDEGSINLRQQLSRGDARAAGWIESRAYEDG